MAINWHNESVASVFKKLGVDSKGLLNDEVRARLKQYGRNELPTKKPTPLFVVAIRQFKSPLMVVLLLAAGGSFVVGDGGDAIVIGLAILINGIVGFIQEWKAERASEALKSYEIAHAQVRRNGVLQEIDARDIVPGDVVVLSEGSRVPSDIRITTSTDLQIDESLLTGESYPVRKVVDVVEGPAGIGDRLNMAFLGTHVVAGKGEGVVIATGQKTELGDIVRLVTETPDEATPLQLQIKRFSWQLGFLFTSVVVAMFIIGIVRGVEFNEMIAIAVALAVASIPEGLLVAVTVVLAIGMQRMLKRKALTRRLVAAETLGSVSVVCTDKTGTITKGVMSVVRVVTREHDLEMHSTLPDEVEEMLLLGALNNDASVDSGKRIGHPTELALVDAAIGIGVDVESVRKNFMRIGEVPFSSDRKYMVTTHRMDGEYVSIIKGAPERIFEMCDMDSSDREYFEQIADEMAQNGLRVLAIATKKSSNIAVGDKVEGAVCIGMVGLQDPLRKSTKVTIKELNSAGIRVVLITGDHPSTARYIARNAGIEIGADGVVTGSELDEMSDEELQVRVSRTAVFARVSPRHKVRIVQAWKNRGQIVAMVGDGVNDAAAMKSADIGVALGSGTDVAKQTSDMVLLDNNLATITSAVSEGRTIFDNIRKIIVYLLADSFSEIVLIGGAILIGLPLPILAVQILWINLVTDGFPHLALTTDPGESDIMQRPPRKKEEAVVNRDMKLLIFIIGIVTDIGLLILFWVLLGHGYDIEHLRTVMFSALALDSLFFVYAVRSLRHSILSIKLFKNRWLNIAVVGGFIMQVLVIYVPFLQELFSTVSLQLQDWLVLIGLSMIKLVVIEITKEVLVLIKRRRYVAQN